jgi:hypothetical protein
MRRLIVSTLVVLIPLLACAQDKDKGKAKSLTDAGLFELRFADGSAVRMALMEPSLDVTTRFGKLNVPWAEVRRIEFGLRYPDGVLAKIETAIAQLGGPDFKAREAAQAELLRQGELAYPHVLKAAREGSPEAMRRARAIAEQMRENIPEGKLHIKPYDTVQTGDFPITGRIDALAFKARSPVFGDATVKLAELRSLRSLFTAGDLDLTIDAAQHGLAQESWLETEMELSGQSLEIRADGKVDLYPLGGERGFYIATPDGARPGGRPTLFPSGALLGKIGKDGKVFLVGSKYDGVPPGEGKLYLRLEASPWGVVPSGSFRVKIAAR